MSFCAKIYRMELNGQLKIANIVEILSGSSISIFTFNIHMAKLKTSFQHGEVSYTSCILSYIFRPFLISTHSNELAFFFQLDHFLSSFLSLSLHPPPPFLAHDLSSVLLVFHALCIVHAYRIYFFSCI